MSWIRGAVLHSPSFNPLLSFHCLIGLALVLLMLQAERANLLFSFPFCAFPFLSLHHTIKSHFSLSLSISVPIPCSPSLLQLLSLSLQAPYYSSSFC